MINLTIICLGTSWNCLETGERADYEACNVYLYP